MSKSIWSNEETCIVCGTPLNLHRHHVYGGVAYRDKSEQYGCWVYLCAYHHNMSSNGIHFNKKLNEQVKQECQRKFEAKYPEVNFREIFGKSYL